MSTARPWPAGPLEVRDRERLSTDRIVEAALALIRTEGYDAVSMRAVAKALGTGPASLYAHVANKDELDQLVVDRIAAQLTLPEPDPDRWDEQVKQAMRQARDLWRAHPGSARASLATAATGDGALRSAAGLHALCRAGGVPDQAAARFCAQLFLYAAAAALEESARTPGDGDEQFEFGLAVLVEGVKALARQERTA
ncbi:MAG: TetR/AcrR family transcriptional regulator [Nocardioidaceae bacterium]